MAPSLTRSHSPVLEARCSLSCNSSRARQSPSEGFSKGRSHKESSRQSRRSRSPSRTSSRGGSASPNGEKRCSVAPSSSLNLSYVES